MVHHIPSSTSTLPTSPITRPTHIADRYDIDTSLVSLVPPPNSLRRSPTAYRCNKYQEKPYILLQRHYRSSVRPLSTTTTDIGRRRRLRYYESAVWYERRIHGSIAVQIVKRREGAIMCPFIWPLFVACLSVTYNSSDYQKMQYTPSIYYVRFSYCMFID